MKLWDCWQSDVEGADVVRRRGPTARGAAEAHAIIEGLPEGTRVTVREVSGSRRRANFEVRFEEEGEP